MVPEAMRAAWILKKDHNLEAIVVDQHTMKIGDHDARGNSTTCLSEQDESTLIELARKSGAVITVEEHQVGCLSGLVARVIMSSSINKIPQFGEIGVNDRFGQSGDGRELIYEFGLSAEHIVAKALELQKAIKQK